MSQISQLAREDFRVAAERTVLVHVQLPGEFVDERDVFGELRALAETAGALVVGELMQKRQRPEAKTYLGKGKVEELARLVEMCRASLVIFDNDLTPAQIRSLEEVVTCKIIDRSELILDIFANRATTHAAKLQVEIAQLEYTFPRLRAMWDHLGQVVGGAPVGIGTRGPGEQQLEIDRRLAKRRLGQLKRELSEIHARRTREVEQRNVDHFTVGLVGYTNAGKSTLFNRLTSGGAFAHGKLFATLSTRIERWDLGGGNHVMLSDTVGFIRNLPHHLVASFRSTLEETIHAQLLIILVDAADPNAEMQLNTVFQTLKEIDAADQPRIIALNKIDQLETSADALVWLNRHPEAIPMSARAGQGLDTLADVVRGQFLGPVREVRISMPSRDGRTIAFLEQRANVLDRTYNAERVEFTVRIGRRQVDQLLARGGDVRINDLPPQEGLRRVWPPRPVDSRRPIPPHHRFHPA
jgi:GTP-binding protein HflX